MPGLSVSHDEAVAQLLRQLESFAATVRALDDLTLLGHSRCDGWSRLDVLVHVRMGLQEMTGGCSARTDRTPDRDAVTYWASAPDDRERDQVPHLLWLRRTAAAYSRPSSAAHHLDDVVAAARTAVQHLADTPVLFQGKTLTSGDFLATWVVELALHELDLDAGGRPAPPGLGLARRTIEHLRSAGLASGLTARAV